MSDYTQQALQLGLDRIVTRENQIQRAIDWLQKAQRYDLQPLGDYQGEGMVCCGSGDWIEWDDVTKAIQILKEGQR